MGYNYAINIEKIKSLKDLEKSSDHDLRKDPALIPNIDVSRSYLNQALIEQTSLEQDYVSLWHKRQFECEANGGDIKLRKNSVYALKLYAGFTHGADDNFDLDDWAKANVEWMQKQFGKENVIAATLHMDESTPHIHAVITPIDENGRLNVKKFTNIRAIRASYNKAMKPFALENGVKYRKSEAKAIKKFYQNINICENTKVPKKEENEPDEIWENRVNAFVQDLRYKWLQDKMAAKKKLGEEEALHKQAYVHYYEALRLYHILEEKFNGDTDMINKQLKRYQTFEQNIPMKGYDSLLTQIEEKIVRNDNLLTIQNTPIDRE